MSGFSFSMTKRREGRFFLKDLILLERIFRFGVVGSLWLKGDFSFKKNVLLVICL